MARRSAGDERSPVPDRPIRWTSGCAAIAAAILLITVLSCSLGTIGLRGGAITPPRIDGAIGSLRLVGYSTWNGSCPPYTGCAPTQRNAYAIWLIWESGALNRSAYQLVDLEIAP
jgi:hypothetical protein